MKFLVKLQVPIISEIRIINCERKDVQKLKREVEKNCKGSKLLVERRLD